MSKEAYVTLATNDTYGLGALVLGRSLRRVATAKQTVVMITPDVSQKMKEELGHVFNLVVTVDLLDSGDVAHLALMKRPELGVTFTKLHAWKLVQFTKCVFLDADTLVVQNCDELFEKEELSAAPDPGWPDCFNSGVFVFVPSETTFKALMDFAVAHGSFDGGDQGLLNMFFREWATQDIRKHLSFVYNVVSSATYSYLPALKFFGSQVKIVHFLGSNKPWLRQSEGSTSTPYQRAWWTIFREDVAGRLSPEMSSSCDENCLHLGSDHNSLKTTDPTEHFSGKHDRFDDCIAAENNTVESTPLQSSSCNERREQIDAGIAGSLAGGVPEEWRREAWEAGDVDYLGRDSFDNIWKRICECVGITAQATSAPDSKPTEPAPAIQKPAETAPVLDKSVEPIGEKSGELTISAEKSVKAAPTSKTPTESAPAQEKSADIPTPEKEVATEKKVVEPTASEKLVESAPSAEKTAEPLPLAEPVPVSKTVADPTPVAENPLESVAEVKPFESVPAAKPAESIPAAKLAESIPAAETLAEPLTTIEKTEGPAPATEKMPDPLPEAEKIAESVPADEKSIEPTPATGKPAEPLPVAEKSVEKLAEPLQTTEKSVETIQATEKPVEPLLAVEKPAEQLEKVLEAVPVLEKKSEPAPVLTDPAPVTEKAVESVAEIHKDASPAPVVHTEPVVEKIAESTLPPVKTPVPPAEVCPLKSTPPSETKQSPPEVPAQAVLPGESEAKSTPSEPLSKSGVAPVCKKEPSTPTVIPPSGPSSPQPADVAPEVCKLQATPSQPATPPASSHQSADAPVPPKRKQGKNGKPGKGKK